MATDIVDGALSLTYRWGVVVYLVDLGRIGDDDGEKVSVLRKTPARWPGSF